MNRAYLNGNSVILRCDYDQVEYIKTIPGRSWEPSVKVWKLPLSPDVIIRIQRIPNILIDEKVFAAAYSIIERDKDILRFKESTATVPEDNLLLNVKPFEHQVKGYNIAMALDASAMLMEQGCGKTLTAIAVIINRYLSKQIEKVLIVAPLSVTDVWLNEFGKFCSIPYNLTVLEGSSDKKVALLDKLAKTSGLKIAVINYESTWDSEIVIKKMGRRDRRVIVRPYISEWAPGMVICDESQRIKNYTSNQSKALHILGQLAKYKLILTGTPETQNPLDFFSQYLFLDERVFGPNFYSFRNRYAIMRNIDDAGRQKMVVAFQNLPEFIRKAHSIAYRVTKAECLDLPDFVDQELYCNLESDAMRQYKEMALKSVMELESGDILSAQNILSKLLRLSQMTGGFIKMKKDRVTSLARILAGEHDEEDVVIQVSKAKLNLLEETIDDLLDAGKKAVIFARFIPELEAIEKMVMEKDIGYSLIRGGTKDRGEEVRRFQEDKNCRIFVAQIQTAGLGITLTAADTAIFYSLDYSFANYDQCRARIHRIGQTNKCTYMHLICRKTVDEKVLRVLKQKKSLADLVVDGWRDFLD